MDLLRPVQMHLMGALKPALMVSKRYLSATSPLPYPRGAVSVVVETAPRQTDSRRPTSEPQTQKLQTCESRVEPQYLLIRRGKEPRSKAWTFPGGKLKKGEDIVSGALRELCEETALNQANGFVLSPTLPVATSFQSPTVDFLIATAAWDAHGCSQIHGTVPQNTAVHAQGDAGEARWFCLKDIQRLQSHGDTVGDLVEIIQHFKALQPFAPS